MRTPGRCTNLEGCWIGATQRDVWLAIGEDFACPNCSSVLTAPPRRSISVQGLKKAAIVGASVTMGMAAMALAGVKLATLHWAAQPTVVAGRHIAGSTLASRAFDLRGTGMRVADTRVGDVQARVLASLTGHASPAPSVSAQAVASDVEDRPSMTLVKSAAPQAVAKLMQDTPPGRSSPSSVVVFAASPQPREAPSDDEVAAAATRVTLISEADFVLPPESRRILDLAVSFGEPRHPEDLDPPANLHWHFHGFVSARQSYFVPLPGREDALSRIIRTPAFLR